MNREPDLPLPVGRYTLYDEIASGGMATVHIGRLLGPMGFSRTVAVKRMHPSLAADPDAAAMFLDESRIAARIRHPNVVSTLDVVALAGELFLVMEYIHGESLCGLLKATNDTNRSVPLPIVSAIMIGALDGLHAAHEAKNERAQPLGIVHRDVSPHNIIVGATDGLARVLDFGIAKARDRIHMTRDKQVKGKLSYMAPEQLLSRPVDRTSDVYSAAVVLWEAITRKRLFGGDGDFKSIVAKVLSVEAEPPSVHATNIPPELDALVRQGLEKDPSKRFRTAREMGRALHRIVPPACAAEVAEWVEANAVDSLGARARRVEIIEQLPLVHPLRVSSVAPPAATDGPKSCEPLAIADQRETIRPSPSSSLAGSTAAPRHKQSINR